MFKKVLFNDFESMLLSSLKSNSTKKIVKIGMVFIKCKIKNKKTPHLIYLRNTDALKTDKDFECTLDQYFSITGTSPGKGTKKVCSGTKKVFIKTKNLSEIHIMSFYLTKQALTQSCFETVCFSLFF